MKSPDEKAMRGVTLGIVIMSLSLLVTTIFATTGYGGFTKWSLVDSVILCICIWRVATKKSIFWMCLASADIFISQAIQISRGTPPNIFWLAIDYCYVRGIYGTIVYYMAKKVSPPFLTTPTLGMEEQTTEKVNPQL